MNLQDILQSNCDMRKIVEMSPIVLAFIGDGVHTLFVRDKVVKGCDVKVNDCHKKSALYCKAESQAKMLDTIMDILTEEEKDIVRRARNSKTNNIAKNSDLVTYKKATSYEALIGYTYLKGDYTRLNEILNYQGETL